MRNFPLSRAVKAFATMKTGLALLAVIIVLAVAGTLIPQERDIHAAGPVLSFLYHTVGLGDLYHSWWFSSLLLLLCLNVAVCSAVRLPALWRDTFAPPVWPDAIAWQRECPLAAPPAEAAALLKKSLSQGGFRVWDMGQGRIYARKGRAAPWGTFLVHASILLIALGGLYGSLAGFRYAVTLAPGETVAIGTGSHPGVGRPFEIRLRGFTTELYPDGRVSDWISSLSVVRDGAELASQDIKVNHPLSFQGISFYQASYTTLYDAERRREGKPQGTVRAGEKQPIILDEHQGIAVIPLKYLPDFDPRQPHVSRSAEPLNPHVICALYSDGRPLGMNAFPLGKSITFPGYDTELIFRAVIQASGLDVKYDPGLPLVFAGFAVMSAAFFLSLYPRRRVVFAVITPAGAQSAVAIAIFGKSPLLAEELARLCAALTSAEDKQTPEEAR